MSPALFNAIRELKQFVVRNIVHILPPEAAFSDLIEHKGDQYLAKKMLARVDSQNEWHFHFTAAIEYPFATDHFMASRYSDGSFPVWYGSMDMRTTIYETVHHFVQEIAALQSLPKTSVIKRKRKVYDVYCNGLLIDLSHNQEQTFLTDDYEFTQSIGKQLYGQGYAGLLAPSARLQKGVNVNIFKQSLLSQPKTKCELTYLLSPEEKLVRVENAQGEQLEAIVLR